MICNIQKNLDRRKGNTEKCILSPIVKERARGYTKNEDCSNN